MLLRPCSHVQAKHRESLLPSLLQVRWLWASGSVLEHNRNMLAKYFLEVRRDVAQGRVYLSRQQGAKLIHLFGNLATQSEDLDYLLFVDSDVGWPPYMIERMVRFG